MNIYDCRTDWRVSDLVDQKNKAKTNQSKSSKSKPNIANQGKSKQIKANQSKPMQSKAKQNIAKHHPGQSPQQAPSTAKQG